VPRDSMADVQQQQVLAGPCPGCGGLPPEAAAASTSSCCRTEHQSVGFSTGAAEGAVEMDPSRRYIRYPLLLGQGACKRVYKGVCWVLLLCAAHTSFLDVLVMQQGS
jgi:hypothetical protein